MRRLAATLVPFGCALAQAFAAACEDCESTTARGPGQVAASRLAAARTAHVSGPGAFELVATSEGALLGWASGPCADGISLQRYDADAQPVGEPRRIEACGPGDDDRAEVAQLSAVAEGGKLALAWVVRRAAADAHVLGTFGADTASAFAPTFLIGAAAAQALPWRSRLALAGGDNGRMRVAFRATPAPCTSGQGQCARVLSSPHPPPDSVAERGVDAREIPDPCPELLVGSLWSQGVWYEALCALEGPRAKPVTEVYAVRPEIFYAEALPVLAGCLPLGMARAPQGVLVVGRCDEGLQVHRLSEAQRVVVTDAVREVRCKAGRPSLEIRNGHGESIVYRLDAPEDRLELWLPTRVAAGVSRAAFTGRTLVVASAHDGELRLRAWKCRGPSLVSDGPSMLYNAASHAERSSDGRLEE